MVNEYYLLYHQVIEETLRMYPPGPAIGRKIPTDMTLHGYKIPKGTLVQVCVCIAIQYII